MWIKSHWKKMILVLGIGVAAIMYDRMDGDSMKELLKRPKEGESIKEVDLKLSLEGIDDEIIDYPLTITAVPLTSERKAELCVEAYEEIQRSVLAGQSEDAVSDDMDFREEYAEGLVQVVWETVPEGYVDADGAVLGVEIPERGILITVEAELQCEDYREIHSFPICLLPKEESEKDRLVHTIDRMIQEEMEGQDEEIVLPNRVEGKDVSWTVKRERIAYKVILLEIVVCILLVFVQKEQRQEKEKKRKERMILDYADIVNRLSVMLGSGMTVRQCLDKISAQYIANRDKNITIRKEGYEEIVHTFHEIQDGESENRAYQNLGDRTDLAEYRRLSRLILQNMKYGSQTLGTLLEQESETAYEEKKRVAKQLGEEAGTKMLAPLMIMLGVVMVIVIAPAMMTFQL